MYSTNITPDKKTGIGEYTDAEFIRAVHQGIARDGKRLYPAMPFASYTYMTDADALAIKAYLFSLQPVESAPPANTLSFPFNQRWLMGFWSAFFNPDKRFEPNTETQCRVEPRCLSCGGNGPLRRVSYAAQCRVLPRQPQEVRRRKAGRLGGLQHLQRQADRASASGRLPRSPSTSRPATRRAAARPTGRWARLSSTA